MADETAVSDMYDEPIDLKAAEEISKRNQPPRGTYVTIMDFEPSVTPTKYEGEDRQFYTVFLRAGQRTKGGEVVEQGLRFKISPDARAKRDQEGNEIPGKDDIATRLWADLVKAYVDHAGEDGEPLKTKGQLFAFLQNTPLAFNTMNGDNGQLIVLNISKPRARR